MARAALLKLFAFSEHRFDAPGEAEALVDLLADGPFALDRYGPSEPARNALDGPGRRQAAALLRGETCRAGVLFLAGDTHKSSFMVEWRAGRRSLWYGEFAAKGLDRAARCDATAAALEALFTRFPAAYAGVATAAAWDARHWLLEEDEDGGEVETKVGLDLRHFLPGVCWWTLFGPVASRFFDRSALLAAPAVAAVDLGEGGVALRADRCPRSQAGGVLSAAETALRDALGRQYFFEISEPLREGPGIPGLTGAGET